VAVRTTRDERVHLPDPVTPALEPVPGCAVCAEWAAGRALALTPGAGYDPARATDCAVRIRRHPHQDTPR
jgi:hypothetical protein